MGIKKEPDITFGDRVALSDADTLMQFITDLRRKGVRTYVGAITLPSGSTVPINVAFERDSTRHREE
jgi:hypothetical protein